MGRSIRAVHKQQTKPHGKYKRVGQRQSCVSKCRVTLTLSKRITLRRIQNCSMERTDVT